MKRKYVAMMAAPTLSVLLSACGNSGDMAQEPDSPSASSSTETSESATTGTSADTETAINLVSISGGTFVMGSPESEENRVEDEIQHNVTVSDFYMAEHEVTQQQYEAVMGENPSSNEGVNKPVENVSWFDTIEFCNRLSEQEGLTPVYTIDGDTYTWNQEANGYRLPTEAEWEYAARAGTTTAYSTGDSITQEQATFGGGGTTDVGSHEANPFGLYDMHGNVFEWCWDLHGEYSEEDQTNPVGAESRDTRVLRGGSCADQPLYLRSALRVYYPPTTEYFDVGFRVVRSSL